MRGFYSLAARVTRRRTLLRWGESAPKSRGSRPGATAGRRWA